MSKSEYQNLQSLRWELAPLPLIISVCRVLELDGYNSFENLGIPVTKRKRCHREYSSYLIL